MLEKNKLYTTKRILEEYELPVCVKKPKWFGDFYFRIEKIEGHKVKGTAYRYGRVHKRLLGGDYEYTLSDEFCLYGENSLKYDEEGYDADGYDRDGFDRNGYDIDGYDEDGYDEDGYDEDGYDKDGFDEDGIDREGYDRNGIHSQSGYVKGKTLLYVYVDEEWQPATFLYFQEKNGKDSVYVDINGEKKFFKYPSDYVKDRKIDVDKIVSIKNKKRYRGNNVDAGLIAKAYKKLPLSRIPSNDSIDEFNEESKYHRSVDTKLNSMLKESKELLKKPDMLNTSIDVEWLINPYGKNFMALDRLGSLLRLNEYRLQVQSSEINKARKEPYFARIDCGPNTEELHTAYLGNYDIGNYVIDWRNSKYGNAYYYSDLLKDHEQVAVALKRVFAFDNSQLKSYEDEINIYNGDVQNQDTTISNRTDELLIKLIEASRNDQEVHDIVRSIQQNQYQIITSDFSQNALVNGCAGSGKTMILYHRLSYMAYNDSENFNPENVYAVTPSSLFDSFCGELIEKLNINEIHNLSYGGTIGQLVDRYQLKYGIVGTRITVDSNEQYSKDYSKYLNDDYYKLYKKQLMLIYDNSIEFMEWFLDEINENLVENGIEPISDGEFYKALVTRKDIGFIIDDRIKTPRFIVSSTRNYRNSLGEIETEYDQSYIPRILAGYSVQNLLESFGEKEQKKTISKYLPVIEQLLSKNTVLSESGFPEKIKAKYLQDINASLTLLNSEKALRAFQKFYSNAENDLEIFNYLCKYACTKTVDLDNVDSVGRIFTLRSLSEKLGALTDDRINFFVDEFQNYSEYEIETLESPFTDCVFNFYGDFDQRLDDKGVSSDYLKYEMDVEEYEIAENYRNATSITEYINNKLGKHMLPIGLSGEVEEQSLANVSISVQGRTALIYKGKPDEKYNQLLQDVDYDINAISYENMNLRKDQVNLIPVDLCKGLEFETVYVIDEGLNENEKYVAYTRALTKLVIIQ